MSLALPSSNWRHVGRGRCHELRSRQQSFTLFRGHSSDQSHYLVLRIGWWCLACALSRGYWGCRGGGCSSSRGVLPSSSLLILLWTFLGLMPLFLASETPSFLHQFGVLLQSEALEMRPILFGPLCQHK